MIFVTLQYLPHKCEDASLFRVCAYVYRDRHKISPLLIFLGEWINVTSVCVSSHTCSKMQSCSRCVSFPSPLYFSLTVSIHTSSGFLLSSPLPISLTRRKKGIRYPHACLKSLSFHQRKKSDEKGPDLKDAKDNPEGW